MKEPSDQVSCPSCGTANSVFDRYCPGCDMRTAWTFADRWHATPTSVRICATTQWLDTLAAGCAFVYLVMKGVRGLRVAAPWQTTTNASHVDVFALAIASVLALLVAVVAGIIAALAYRCGSGLLRGRSSAWELSVCWLGLAAVAAIFLRLDLLVLFVICAQLATLFTPGVRQHMLHSNPRTAPPARKG